MFNLHPSFLLLLLNELKLLLFRFQLFCKVKFPYLYNQYKRLNFYYCFLNNLKTRYYLSDRLLLAFALSDFGQRLLQGAYRGDPPPVLRLVRAGTHQRPPLRVLGHVETLHDGAQGQGQPGHERLGSLPHRVEHEQGHRSGQSKGGEGAGGEGSGACPYEVEVVSAQAAREPHRGAGRQASRPAPIQPPDSPGLPAQGGLPTLLELRPTQLGRPLSRPLVYKGHALSH